MASELALIPSLLDLAANCPSHLQKVKTQFQGPQSRHSPHPSYNFRYCPWILQTGSVTWGTLGSNRVQHPLKTSLTLCQEYGHSSHFGYTWTRWLVATARSMLPQYPHRTSLETDKCRLDGQTPMTIHRPWKGKELIHCWFHGQERPTIGRSLLTLAGSNVKMWEMLNYRQAARQENKETQREPAPTGALLWPETEVEGVQPWQPGPLDTTDTWTGLQAWKKQRETTHDSSYLYDVKQNNNLFHMKSNQISFLVQD